MPEPALELQHISRSFPGVLANDDVSLRVQPGTVHGLVGENGTGKTTLMRIAYGLLRPDQGSVRIDGRELGRGGPARAIELGLGMVHQHFMLVPTLSVAENVVLGQEPRQGPWLDRRRSRQWVQDTAQRFGLHVRADALVETLSVGEQQRVEILKVLLRGARVLILDEPTAVLTPQEVDELFAILRRLVQEGHAVLLISHRLSEVLRLADTITVMRRGRVVGEVPGHTADRNKLARLMVGRDLEPVHRPPARQGDVVLELHHVETDGAHDRLRGVDLQLRSGEILGIAGVDGNGQTALAEAILGLTSTRGRILLDGEELQGSTAARRAAGMGYVPSDRLREAVIPAFSVAENLLLGRQHEPSFGHGPFLDLRATTRMAEAAMAAFEVQPANGRPPVSTLSGGNQQRLVLARELGRNPRVLLLAQPTRGVDVGGIDFIHRRILAARAEGKAVLLISADLDEVMELADRIAVLFEGRIVGEVDAAQADAQTLGLWMTGSSRSQA
jgi:simple sugar transport system ATP-binding protein